MVTPANSRWAKAQMLDDISKGIENDKYGFDHPIFADLKKRQEDEDHHIVHPPEIVEGVVECHRCGSKKVFSVSVQTRAADEPMSTRAQCMNCKARWTQNC